MRKIFFLLIILLSIRVAGQPFHYDRKPKNCIYIRNAAYRHFYTLRTGLWVKIFIRNGEEISGKIEKVDGGTITLNGNNLDVGEIDSLFLHIRMPKTLNNQQFPQPTGLIYETGNPWALYIIPPDQYYSDPWYRKAFITSMKKSSYKSHRIYQDSASLPRGNNFIKLNLAKIFHLELALAYERRINPLFSWEIELSAIYGINEGPPLYLLDGPPAYGYDGFSVTTIPKFYLFGSRTYVGPVFMYRYGEIFGLSSTYPHNENYSNYMLQDQFRNDFGMSIRFGRINNLIYSGGMYEIYFGAGLKLTMLHQLAYNYSQYSDGGMVIWINPDHSAATHDYLLLSPMLNLGIKVGIDW